jgi:hypothetical protein
MLQHPLADETHGVVEQRMGSCARNRLAGVALVADPHVAVIVVAALFGALGQQRGRRSDHPASGAGEPPHDRVGVASVAVGHGPVQLGDLLALPGLGRLPGALCVGDRRVTLAVDHHHQVVLFAAAQAQLADKLTPAVCTPAHPRLPGAHQPQMGVADGPVQIPCSSRRRPLQPRRPQSLRTSSRNAKDASPRRTTTRRRITARRACAGTASASWALDHRAVIAHPATRSPATDSDDHDRGRIPLRGSVGFGLIGGDPVGRHLDRLDLGSPAQTVRACRATGRSAGVAPAPGSAIAPAESSDMSRRSSRCSSRPRRCRLAKPPAGKRADPQRDGNPTKSAAPSVGG